MGTMWGATLRPHTSASPTAAVSLRERPRRRAWMPSCWRLPRPSWKSRTGQWRACIGLCLALCKVFPLRSEARPPSKRRARSLQLSWPRPLGDLGGGTAAFEFYHRELRAWPFSQVHAAGDQGPSLEELTAPGAWELRLAYVKRTPQVL